MKPAAVRAAAAIVAAGALLLAASPQARTAAIDEGDFAGPEWNQWGGNPSRTFAADVEPVVSGIL